MKPVVIVGIVAGALIVGIVLYVVGRRPGEATSSAVPASPPSAPASAPPSAAPSVPASAPPSAPAPASAPSAAAAFGPAEAGLSSRFAYFRALGFFDDLARSPERDAVQEIVRRLGKAPTTVPNNPRADYETVKADAARVWWRDLDAEPSPKSKTYEKTLREWASISRGAFSPTEVQETWDYEVEENGAVKSFNVRKIEISFTAGSRARSLRLRYLADALDMQGLLKVNEVIAPSGYQFEACLPSSDAVLVVVLTADEKRRLVQERGWKFVR